MDNNKKVVTTKHYKTIHTTYDNNSTHIDKVEIEEVQSSNVFFSDYDDGVDDEVFLEFEENVNAPIQFETETRIRRRSDVIDSIGFLGDKRDDDAKSSIFSVGSPPVTPSGSDAGYHSNGAGPATPPSSSLIFKPKWFRKLSDKRHSASSLEGPTRRDSQDSKFEFNIVRSTTDFPNINRIRDGTDSKVYSQAFTSRSNLTVKAVMPTDKYSTEYNMNHSERGRAIIFNHEYFKMEMPRREGSQVDVNALENVYKLLGFEVDIYNDLNYEEIEKVLNNLSKEMDHTNNDCLVVNVLTHGFDSDYLLSHDYPYKVERLWQPFTGDQCVTLAGKPKIFIIQACRGDQLDNGLHLISNTQTDSGKQNAPYKIPKTADFVLAFSTFEGFYSWRHPEDGTWFIQSFCQILKEHYEQIDLHRILTRVCCRVAVDFESFNDLDIHRNEQKQMPSILSTLIREIYFRPKK